MQGGGKWKQLQANLDDPQDGRALWMEFCLSNSSGLCFPQLFRATTKCPCGTWRPVTEDSPSGPAVHHHFLSYRCDSSSYHKGQYNLPHPKHLQALYQMWHLSSFCVKVSVVLSCFLGLLLSAWAFGLLALYGLWCLFGTPLNIWVN